jgi:hypothetical protein
MNQAEHDAVVEELQQTNEYVFDPATAKPILHNWVNRGLKVSCEGAGHPHHEAWLKQPM